MRETIFLHRFLENLHRFLRRFLVRRFFYVLALGKQVLQSHAKNAQKICGKICGVQMALLKGVPHSISAVLSRQHVIQSPLGRRTQGEHVRVHRDIFGLKGMLAFAPGISKIFKNPLCEPPTSRPRLVVLANSWERTRRSKQASYQGGFPKRRGPFWLLSRPPDQTDRITYIITDITQKSVTEIRQ